MMSHSRSPSSPSLAMEQPLQSTQGLKRKRSLDAGTATACDQCHRCKVRCSSGRPSCERCERSGSTCTYSLGKPLGKPPKHSRQKVWRPTPTSSPRSAVGSGGQDGNFDRIGFPHLHRYEDVEQSDQVSFSRLNDTRSREMSLNASVQHGIAGDRPLSAPYDDGVDLEQAQNAIFSASTGQGYFPPAEADIDLGYLDDPNFSRQSIMHAGSPSSPNTNSAVVGTSDPSTSRKTDGSRHFAAVEPSPSSYPTPTSRARFSATPSSEPLQEAPPISSMSPIGSFTSHTEANKLSAQGPTLLETVSHLCSKIPSTTRPAPISEVLQLARQGLQAVYQCLPQSQHHASEGSGLILARSANHETDILAGILLIQQVLTYYDSLLQQHSATPAPTMVSPPSSSTDTHPPFPRPSFSSNRAISGEPIRIGDFEVDCTVGRQLILDTVVEAERQKARNAFWRLEKWARELVDQGRQEGLLAAAFLKPLKRRLGNASS